MPVAPARQIAFEILLRVEREAAFASELLHARLGQLVSERDAALATELVMGSLRRQRELDFFIERYTGKQASALDAEALIALRLGIYQLRRLSRIPPHAAVSESVEMVKRSRKKSSAGLVNALLRRAATERASLVGQFLSASLRSAERLSIIHSHPAWLIERWIPRFDEAETIALLESNNARPATACATIGTEMREQAIRSLSEDGVETEPGRLSRNAFIIPSGSVQKTKAFQNGWIFIQDEASQLVPLLLEVRRGDSVLDLCAAPGGKTIALAHKAGQGSFIVAADLHEHRLRSMRDRLRAANCFSMNLVALDATLALPFRARFDRILVDAPCSGTGTLARNPEIRWRLTPGDLPDLHRRQTALLSSALDCLSPHGRLIYSTCSLEPEENEQVIDEVLAAHPEFRRVRAHLPADSVAAGAGRAQVINPEGLFHTFPPDHHTDGFFAAAIERG